MKSFTVLAFLFLFCQFSLMAEPTSTEVSKVETTQENPSQQLILKGHVVDQATSEALVGVALMVNGEKVYTDFDGNFQISNICQGNCIVVVNYISYQEQIIEVNLHENATLNISMEQR